MCRCGMPGYHQRPGQEWLLAKRKVENWILLNISNLFAIPLLWYKHLIMFSALTLFLFIVAIFGYFDWLAILKKEKAAEKSLSTQ